MEDIRYCEKITIDNKGILHVDDGVRIEKKFCKNRFGVFCSTSCPFFTVEYDDEEPGEQSEHVPSKLMLCDGLVLASNTDIEDQR